VFQPGEQMIVKTIENMNNGEVGLLLNAGYYTNHIVYKTRGKYFIVLTGSEEEISVYTDVTQYFNKKNVRIIQSLTTEESH
jgi:hypothetical protein